MSLAAYLNHHFILLNRFCWGICLCPALYLFYQYQCNALGINPFEYLLSFTGHTAIIIFTLSYAIVPIRRWVVAYCTWRKLDYGKRLADWNFLVRNRRMLGLNSFYYGSLHLILYLDLELDYDWFAAIDDMQRIFIAIAWLAWIMLLSMAITSPQYVQKNLVKNWKKIHRTIHLLALLLLLHIYFESKLTNDYLWIYATIFFGLMLHRVAVLVFPSLLNKRDSGEEVHR